MYSPSARLRPLILTCGALVAILLVAAPMASAAKYQLGIGDSPVFPAEESAPLHAVASRVVIDPATPLAPYHGQIPAPRAIGHPPQIVVGGTGTVHHKSTAKIVTTAVAAAKRWKPLY